jgi:class 3 adenylate cyclase
MTGNPVAKARRASVNLDAVIEFPSLKPSREAPSVVEERLHRRLAAILATDVVGYSHPMEIDETGTLARLKAMRRDLIDPMIAAHSGRTIAIRGNRAISRDNSSRALGRHRIDDEKKGEAGHVVGGRIWLVPEGGENLWQ